MHETEERTRQTQPSRVAPAERRGILSWPIAVGVVLVAIVLVLVGSAIAIRTLSPTGQEVLGVVPTIGPSFATRAPIQQPQARPTGVLATANAPQEPTAVPAATVAAIPPSATVTPQTAVSGQVSPIAAATLDARTANDVKDAYQR